MNARVGQKPIEWQADSQTMYSSEPVAHIEVMTELHTLSYTFTFWT